MARSLRQQYFHFHNDRDVGRVCFVVFGMFSVPFLLFRMCRKLATSEMAGALYSDLSVLAGEKKLSTSFSLPNLSEAWIRH